MVYLTPLVVWGASNKLVCAHVQSGDNTETINLSSHIDLHTHAFELDL